ncbi:hypothetical protein AB205_0168710 [Aquarana catesbeiana]|uniref:Uncharacterized protein n=1 Tax=Aquarana catesbeiana TaxID=8400 RepID=A0A2G9NL20_AQUCT|nr:hypothetical protein AB205_0168710 [Aquarana catesbeiana]
MVLMSVSLQPPPVWYSVTKRQTSLEDYKTVFLDICYIPSCFLALTLMHLTVQKNRTAELEQLVLETAIIKRTESFHNSLKSNSVYISYCVIIPFIVPSSNMFPAQCFVHTCMVFTGQAHERQGDRVS